MFEYFPGNYVWNLAVVATLNNGGRIDDVDRACRPVLEAARQGADAGTQSLYEAWAAVADRVVAAAEADAVEGKIIGAGEGYYLGSLYTSQAERLQSPGWSGRNAAYQKSIDLLLRHMELSGAPVALVEVPYGGGSLPGYLYRAPSADGEPGPIIIEWNGLDSTKEMMYYSGFPQELARRGISTLMVDTPGSGEALRLRGLRSRFDTEVWAAACVDYLTALGEFDPERIGLVGWSLGGYYAPRAAAYEKRIKLVVSWGANYDWGETQQRRRRREGEHPVPHYWDHVQWVWGAKDLDEFFSLSKRVSLDGVLEEIAVPYLITHGIADRQIPVADAHRSYAEAVNSPDRELRIFTPEEGGVEHIGLDNFPLVSQFTADWIAARFTS
ncbi:alpha/beta hydrolase family protein [Microbacterium sediminicola]|uniref:alpha/beta hydrolase family protein n=1 Tax=Microbacterium sediminicola TaxID=415210 RepID=UPI0031D64F60